LLEGALEGGEVDANQVSAISNAGRQVIPAHRCLRWRRLARKRVLGHGKTFALVSHNT